MRGADEVDVAVVTMATELGVGIKAGVDAGPSWGVLAQLEGRELVGVLPGEISISSSCESAK